MLIFKHTIFFFVGPHKCKEEIPIKNLKRIVRHLDWSDTKNVTIHLQFLIY